MFDFTPNPTDAQETASPRVLALELIAHSSAHLRRGAARLGGNAGLALVCATRDMFLDATIDPLHWPIDEVIALFRQSAPVRDIQVDLIVAQLERIRDRIGSGSNGRAA